MGIVPIPQIKYPSSVIGGGQTTLVFTYRPVKMPSFVKESIRHDNRASSGVQEVVFERTDQFWEGEMEYVARGADVNAWAAFEDSALQGIPFDLYDDHLVNSFVTYYLDDKVITAAYKIPGYFNFKHKLYQYVSWP